MGGESPLMIDRLVSAYHRTTPLTQGFVIYDQGGHFGSGEEWGLMNVNSFKSYALSERQLRWQIKCAVQNIENLVLKYRESKDGMWIDCRRFASAWDVKCYIAKDSAVTVGAKDFI